MYTIRLQQAPRQGASYASVAAGTAAALAIGASGSGSSQPSPSGTPPPDGVLAASALAEELEHITFSAGNPRVEHLVGRVSLFRHLPQWQSPGHIQQQQQSGSTFSSEIEPAAPGDQESPRSAAEAHQCLPVSAFMLALCATLGRPTMLHAQAGRLSRGMRMPAASLCRGDLVCAVAPAPTAQPHCAAVHLGVASRHGLC
jgi:hypothetical protein